MVENTTSSGGRLVTAGPVLVVASPGGHFSQAVVMTARVANRIFISYPPAESHVTKDGAKVDVLRAHNTRFGVWGHFLNFWIFLSYFLKLRPRAILSTGGPFCLTAFVVAKLFGTKSIYIDTISRVDAVSNTCRLLARLKLSDEIYTQWPHLADESRRIGFNGSIIDLRDGGHSGQAV